MNIQDIHEYIFPIGEGKNSFSHFLGTGFFVKENGVLISVKHVLPEQNAWIMMVGPPPLFSCTYYRVEKVVHHNLYDLSIGKVNLPIKNKYFSVSSDQFPMGTQTWNYGFGDSEYVPAKNEITFNPRYFNGYIVSCKTIDWHGNKTPSYELPYPVFKGASGSPILNDSNVVVGLAYATHQSRIEAHREEEVIHDQSKTKTYIYNEYKSFGLAMRSTEVASFIDEVTAEWAKT